MFANALSVGGFASVVHCAHETGTEEMGHWEMIGTMIRQCMAGVTCAELNDAGLAGYYIMHDHGVYPCDPNGVPFSAKVFAVTGDPVADLVEDMAADAAFAKGLSVIYALIWSVPGVLVFDPCDYV